MLCKLLQYCVLELFTVHLTALYFSCNSTSLTEFLVCRYSTEVHRLVNKYHGVFMKTSLSHKYKCKPSL